MCKISVIIPTYNTSKYIAKAINSVLEQTYQDFEIVVIDDGSNDNTKEIVSGIIEKYPEKIRYFYKKNGGPSSARNFGVEKSSAEYVAFLDSDDYWLNDKLAKSISFLEANNFDWIATSSYKLYENKELKLLETPELSNFVNNKTNEMKQLEKGLFYLPSSPVYMHTVLIKKSIFRTVGYLNEDIKIGEDHDLWLRIEEAGFRGGYLNEPLAVYRCNEESLTKKNKISYMLKELAGVVERHAKILGLKNTLIRKTYSDVMRQTAVRLFLESDYECIAYFVKAVFYNPSTLFSMKKVKTALSLFFRRKM